MSSTTPPAKTAILRTSRPSTASCDAVGLARIPLRSAMNPNQYWLCRRVKWRSCARRPVLAPTRAFNALNIVHCSALGSHSPIGPFRALFQCGVVALALYCASLLWYSTRYNLEENKQQGQSRTTQDLFHRLGQQLFCDQIKVRVILCIFCVCVVSRVTAIVKPHPHLLSTFVTSVRLDSQY